MIATFSQMVVLFQLYEEEKEENGRLRKELEQTKKELLEAKNELDRLMRRSESSRNSDSTDKRVCACSSGVCCRLREDSFDGTSQDCQELDTVSSLKLRSYGGCIGIA